MDDFHIVFEAPQEGQAKKKRARLVTSCDHWCASQLLCHIRTPLMRHSSAV